MARLGTLGGGRAAGDDFGHPHGRVRAAAVLVENGLEHRFARPVRLGLLAGDRSGIGEIACRGEIGRAHVCTTVTNAPLVCRLLLAKKKTPLSTMLSTSSHN